MCVSTRCCRNVHRSRFKILAFPREKIYHNIFARRRSNKIIHHKIKLCLLCLQSTRYLYCHSDKLLPYHLLRRCRFNHLQRYQIPLYNFIIPKRIRHQMQYSTGKGSNLFLDLCSCLRISVYRD